MRYSARYTLHRDYYSFDRLSQKPFPSQSTAVGCSDTAKTNDNSNNKKLQLKLLTIVVTINKNYNNNNSTNNNKTKILGAMSHGNKLVGTRSSCPAANYGERYDV